MKAFQSLLYFSSQARPSMDSCRISGLCSHPQVSPFCRKWFTRRETLKSSFILLPLPQTLMTGRHCRRRRPRRPRDVNCVSHDFKQFLLFSLTSTIGSGRTDHVITSWGLPLCFSHSAPPDTPRVAHQPRRLQPTNQCLDLTQ